MEKKKLSIELPKGGMSDLTKQVRNNPIIEPLADATEWQRLHTIWTSSKTSRNMGNASGYSKM